MENFSRFSTRGKYKFRVRRRNGSSDSNGIRIHNHLVCRRTPNHLAKLTKWLWVLIFTVHLTVCYYVTYEFESEATLYSLPEYQGTPCLKQASYLKFKWRIPLLPLKLQIWRLLQAKSSLKFRQTTVNDEISTRGAYLKISSWQRALNRQGRLIKQGRLLNFVQNSKFIFYLHVVFYIFTNKI